MRFLKFVFVLLFITACKSTSTLTPDASKELKKLSSRKIIKNHLENSFSANTVDARLKVQYSDNKNDGIRKRQSLTVRLRIQKDSVIWIKGKKVINAFRAKITPNSFSYYSSISKEYFTGDYTLLKQLLGVDITFKQLQSIFLGESIWDMKKNRFESSLADNSYKLTPKKQEELYLIFFYFHPENFRVKKLFIDDKAGKTLRIDYNSYIKKSNELFPKRIQINATEKAYYTFISLDVKSLELNKPLSMPYRIPEGYKELVVKK